jgi:hypothetical protein
MRALTKQQNIATELSFLLERDGVGPAPDRAFLFSKKVGGTRQRGIP